MDRPWDCIVVGGGAAGLSAALTLGRARRPTLVVDAGSPSNAPAHGIGGVLGHDGRPPAGLYALGREEIARYPSVEVRGGEVTGGERDEEGRFALTLADGTAETAHRVLLATGMDYVTADLPGMAERWGRTVFHCPFCHGWEVQDRALAVLDHGATGVHRALLLRSWSDDVTLLTNGPAGLEPEAEARLRALSIEVDEREVAGVRGPDGDDALEAVVFADGSERRCEGLLAGIALRQRSTLAADLGAAYADPNPLTAEALELDGMLQTTVAGLYAAGDVVAKAPSVANAVASGAMAAGAIVGDLQMRAADQALGGPPRNATESSR